MNLLVTGGGGYLGSVLLPKLIARGHRIRVLDIGYFGLSHLKSMKPKISIIQRDICDVIKSKNFLEELLEGCDAVIHLAALSNDPSAELNPELTNKINYESTAVLAEEAKKRRIKFIFSSSCSIYGGASELIDETGDVAPLTAYAFSKVNSEKFLLELKDLNWNPVILRNGTLFGYSPRMRFDLVVNIFSLYSVLYGKIKIFGGGTQWRPFLHVDDCARAFVHFSEAKNLTETIFNIAHVNCTVHDVADIFKQIIPSLVCEDTDQLDPDLRNYRVVTERMKSSGFQTRFGIMSGAEAIIDLIISGHISDPESIFYKNVKWLKELDPESDPSLIRKMNFTRE